MSSKANSNATPEKGVEPIDLTEIFKHPEGLRTARSIVQSIITASSSNNISVQGPFSSLPVSFLGSNNSISETTEILRDLLAFKDTEEQGEAAALERSHGRGRVMNSASSDTFHQLGPNEVSTSMQHTSFDTSTNHQLYNAGTMFMPGTTVMNAGEPRNGTDSPYRVESPFRPENTSTAPLRSVNRTQPSVHGAAKHISNNYHIDQPPNPRVMLPNGNQHPIGATRNERSGTSFSESRSLGHPLAPKPSMISSVGRIGMKEPTSIKSFLPINKGGEAHNTHHRKELPKLKPTTNRLIMPNSLAPSTMSLRTTDLVNNKVSSQPSGTDNKSLTLLLPLEMDTSNPKPVSKKRRKNGDAEGAPVRKKQITEKGDKVKRVPKVKEPKPEPARYKIGPDLWMRILEFTPPSFLRKARTLSKEFKTMVDQYQSIYFNQRLENFGEDMPGPSPNISERQYNDLLSGKGCMEPGCPDKKASRTHWSWEIRLCQSCWKGKIAREDRLQKIWQPKLTRNGINRLLECIPVGMHDSFMKPHDYIEDVESRGRSAPRLYRYHFNSDVEKIVDEYEAMKAPPFEPNPEHSAAEKATALAAHQALEAEFTARRSEFLDKRKAENDLRMKRVVKIETAIRERRSVVAKPYEANRNARKERFTKAALDELPHIPLEFVKKTKCYKAAVRIFRDAGSDRGWGVLKDKIVSEWEARTQMDNSITHAVEDNTSTRENSTVHEAESGQDSVSQQVQLQAQNHHNPQQHHNLNDTTSMRTNHQHSLNMAPLHSNGYFSGMNGNNQHHSSARHPLMNTSAFQPHGGPPSLMYTRDSMTADNFNISGPSLQQMSSNFMPYNNHNLYQQGSSSQIFPTKHIPINSLLNGPSPGAAQNLYPWTGPGN